jgi:hypothetical protein
MGCPRSPQKTNQRPAARTMSSCSAIATGSGSLARPRRERRVRRCLGALTPASAASAAASSARPSPPEICGSMLHSTRLCSTRPGNPSETPPEARLVGSLIQACVRILRHAIAFHEAHDIVAFKFFQQSRCVFGSFRVLCFQYPLVCSVVVSNPWCRRCVRSREWKFLNS